MTKQRKVNHEQEFLESIKDHQLEIYRDDGVDRHLKFRKPDTICMWFDIITWKGSLMIDGDMGTFVFRRLEDMFMFFRPSDGVRQTYPDRDLHINLTYWAEKLQATPPKSHGNGYNEYSQDKFRETIKEWFDDYFYEADKDERIEAWGKVEYQVLNMGEIEHDAIRAAMDFEYAGHHPFQNAWEMNFRVYTYHFIWCLYAIVWGIQQYDEIQEGVSV